VPAREQETAEQATSVGDERDALCGSVFVGRTFVAGLPIVGRVTMGRNADCDLQLADASVSRHHARFDMRGDHGTVSDLGSRNGTWVNGRRLTDEKRRVARGDEVRLGSVRIALFARSMVPSGVRPVLVRSALLHRIDEDLAGDVDLEVLALRLPQCWYEIEGLERLLATLPPSVYVGTLGDLALLLAGAAGSWRADALELDPWEAQTGRAAQRDEHARSAEQLVTAALSSLCAKRAPARASGAAPVATGTAMRRVYEEAATIAPTMVSVLLIGETGVGKEVLARTIHEQSGRPGRLVSVNTAALPESLVESELFGHERGAFSGAHQTKVGLIEAANGGTLFLDEIGDLPPSLQAKLLRVLEERSVRRVGSTQERKVDVRVVAATHRDLERAVAENEFRRDLLFRLNACTLRIPPLRERVDEIGSLAEAFLAEVVQQAKLAGPRAIAADALDALRRYAWPGNVRELRNVVERGVALAHGRDVLRSEHLPDGITSPGLPDGARSAAAAPDAGSDVRGAVNEYERARIVEALTKAAGNQSAAAKLLGLPRRTLAYKMARLGIRVPHP
jgi:DNA-binding NtrC family response regulator